MKKSRTVIRRRQSESPALRHLPLVDILVDAQAELQELVVQSELKVLEAMFWRRIVWRSVDPGMRIHPSGVPRGRAMRPVRSSWAGARWRCAARASGTPARRSRCPRSGRSPRTTR